MPDRTGNALLTVVSILLAAQILYTSLRPPAIKLSEVDTRTADEDGDDFIEADEFPSDHSEWMQTLTISIAVAFFLLAFFARIALEGFLSDDRKRYVPVRLGFQGGSRSGMGPGSYMHQQAVSFVPRGNLSSVFYVVLAMMMICILSMALCIAGNKGLFLNMIQLTRASLFLSPVSIGGISGYLATAALFPIQVIVMVAGGRLAQELSTIFFYIFGGVNWEGNKPIPMNL